MGEEDRQPSKQSLRALEFLNVFLADVPGGVGPFLAVYLAAGGNVDIWLMANRWDGPETTDRRRRSIQLCAFGVARRPLHSLHLHTHRHTPHLADQHRW
jgi:hypothetical protein